MFLLVRNIEIIKKQNEWMYVQTIGVPFLKTIGALSETSDLAFE